MSEFWELSPAQVSIIFEGLGLIRKKSGVSDIMSFAKQFGLA